MQALKIKLKPRKELLATSAASPIECQNPSPQQTITNEQEIDAEHVNTEEEKDGKEEWLKRKHPSPSSPFVSKKVSREGSPLSGYSQPEVFLTSTGGPEVVPEKSEQLSVEPLVVKKRLRHYHSSVAAFIQREQQGRVEDDGSRLRSSSIALENISHGQLQVLSVVPFSVSTSRVGLSGQDDIGALDSVQHASLDAALSQHVYPFAAWSRPDPKPGKDHKVAVLPAHAGWFTWENIHKLERQAMPQFFFGKSKLSSAEAYIHARNDIIMKYRWNPQKPISLLDIRGAGNLSDKELGHILEFLIQWGLVNYQSELRSESAGFKYPAKVPVYLDEDEVGLLSLPHIPLTSLEYLYHYDPLHAPAMALKSLVTDQEPSNLLAENVVKEAGGMAGGGSSGNSCSVCAGDCSVHHYYCEKQADYILCAECYGNGKLGIGMTTGDFAPSSGHSEVTDNFDNGSWSDQETLMLLEGLEVYGDNWTEVSEFVGTKSKAQCISHFIGLSIEDRFFEDMEVPRSFMTARTNQKMGLHTQKERAVRYIDLEAKVPVGFDKPEPLMDTKTPKELLQGEEAERCMAFEGASNPVMSLIAFLAATVGPRVAAVAAHAALSSLSEEYRALMGAADKQVQSMPTNSSGSIDTGGDNNRTIAESATDEGSEGDKVELDVPNSDHAINGGTHQLSRESTCRVTAVALSTAAMKTKLLADQEEREVQRLAAIIVDNQLKKLSTKLKQLGDIDAVLEKEREQMERNRQRIAADRLRFITSRLSNTGAPPQMPVGNPGPMNIRPGGPLTGQGGVPAGMCSGAVLPTGAAAAAMPSGAVLPPGAVAVMPSGVVLPSGAVMPSGAPGPSGAVMPSGAVIPLPGLMPSAGIHPSHILRPTLFTIGPGGMAIPVSASMIKPPS